MEFIFNVHQFLNLAESYKNIMKASKEFQNELKKTIIEFMSVNNIERINISDCFLQQPVEVCEGIVIKMNIENILLHEGNLLIEFNDKETYSDFNNLTPTELLAIYIMHFEDGIKEIKKVMKEM